MGLMKGWIKLGGVKWEGGSTKGGKDTRRSTEYLIGISLTEDGGRRS